MVKYYTPHEFRIKNYFHSVTLFRLCKRLINAYKSGLLQGRFQQPRMLDYRRKTLTQSRRLPQNKCRVVRCIIFPSLVKDRFMMALKPDTI